MLLEVCAGLQQSNLDNEDIETHVTIVDSFMPTVERTISSVRNVTNCNFDDIEEDTDALIAELKNSIHVMEIADLEASRLTSKMHTSSVEDEKIIDQLKDFSCCMSKQNKSIPNSRDSTKRESIQQRWWLNASKNDNNVAGEHAQSCMNVIIRFDNHHHCIIASFKKSRNKFRTITSCEPSASVSVFAEMVRVDSRFRLLNPTGNCCPFSRQDVLKINWMRHSSDGQQK